MKHLAIFKGDGAEKILTGKKTIESRFSKNKIAPYGVVSAGDLVYMKLSGGAIIGQFRVKKVIYYDDPERADYRYVSDLFIGDSSRFITSPIKPIKKDLRGWMVLG